MTYPTLKLLVDGEWLGLSGRESQEVRDPADGTVLGQLPFATDADVDWAVEAATREFRTWSRTPALERARALQAIAAQLRQCSTRLATTLTLEQGKTLSEAHGEIAGTADTFEWMAEEAKRVYGRIVPSRLRDTEQLVSFEPVGPVAAFAPWNYPAVLAARKVAAALAAGCTVVLKPAEETPGIMVAIAEICQKSGIPAGVLNVIYGAPDRISRQLINDARIQKISFTGSVQVGQTLAALAGQRMKSITLELGGHSPVIVDRDVDLAKLVPAAAAAKFRNAGQICHAPTRFIVHDSIAEEFAHTLAARAGALRLGHGLQSDVQMGPLTHARRVSAMQELCEDACSRGARLLCGGVRRESLKPGFFFEPTVILDADESMLAMREEAFGPLALISRFDAIEQAIEQANSVDLGLGAYAFSKSYESVRQIQTEIAAGSVSINTFAITPPEMPFSGWKQSGLGTEMGIEGLREYVKTKSIIRAPI